MGSLWSIVVLCLIGFAAGGWFLFVAFHRGRQDEPDENPVVDDILRAKLRDAKRGKK